MGVSVAVEVVLLNGRNALAEGLDPLNVARILTLVRKTILRVRVVPIVDQPANELVVLLLLTLDKRVSCLLGHY